MRKRLLLFALVGLFAVGGTAPTALAGAGNSVRVAQEETEDDDGTDYGWIGLLGLAGLAGLLGRKRDDRGDTGSRTTR